MQQYFASTGSRSRRKSSRWAHSVYFLVLAPLPRFGVVASFNSAADSLHRQLQASKPQTPFAMSSTMRMVSNSQHGEVYSALALTKSHSGSHVFSNRVSLAT
jgi:hypothetical protein